jgi:single-strand DNA-binding protein
MPRSINRITLIGNLGADPEVRVLASERRVARMRLATTRSWRDDDGELHEKTQWHTVVAWNGSADFASKYLSKGDRIYVEGEMEYREYEARDGARGFAAEVISRQIIPLTKSAPKPEPELELASAGSDEDPFV